MANFKQVDLSQTGANATAIKVDGSAVTQPVSGTVGVSGTVPVSGTFWQATQPVSGTVGVSSLPGTSLAGQTAITADYDTGAGTSNVSLLGFALPASGGPVAGGTSTNPIRTDPTGATVQPVSGTFWQATQPVSAASLPLPTGAATSAKQPALGTAGSASADVLSVQGVASMTALKVDGSAVTQPVSAASLPLPTGAAQDSTLTGGTAKSINRGGAKGATTAADVTSTAEGTDHQAIDVQVYHGGAAVNPASIRALTSADVVTVNNSFALDATLTGGTAKAINRGGAKGTTTAADITSTASGANHQPMDVAIYDASGNLKDPTQIRALTSADVVTVNNATAANLKVDLSGTAANATALKVDGSAVTQPVSQGANTRVTYAAPVAAFTPPATPTDMITVVGSATKTIRITRIELFANQTTAALQEFFFIRRATNTGGTTSAVTIGTYDGNSAAPTATVFNYTANPSALGAVAANSGTIRRWRGTVPTPTTATGGPIVVYDFVGRGQEIILRGTGQIFAINFGGAALPTGLSISANIEFTEE